MSARIDPPGRYPWLARLAFRYTRRITGKVPDPLRIFARRPRLMFSTVVYEWAIAGHQGGEDECERPCPESRTRAPRGLRPSHI